MAAIHQKPLQALERVDHAAAAEAPDQSDVAELLHTCLSCHLVGSPDMQDTARKPTDYPQPA